MKKLLAILAIILLTNATFAQVTEGKIKYKLDFTSSDPSMQAQLAMFSGSTMTIYFSPEFSRTEMNMGMFINTTMIFDLSKKKGVTLVDGMMGKKGIKMDNIDNLSDNPDAAEVEFETTNEKKKIAGYNCTKLIMTTEDGVINYWVTEDIAASTKGIKYINSKVTGVPLEFELNTNGFTMKFIAVEVTEKLKGENKKTLFSTDIPEGYEIVTEEDLKKLGM